MRPRPILVVETARARKGPKRPPVELDWRIGNRPLSLPRRVVLRVDEVSRLGRALLFTLLRRLARGRVLPSTVAIEIDPTSLVHLKVSAALLAFCDPTPRTSRVLRSCCAAVRRDNKASGRIVPGDWGWRESWLRRAKAVLDRRPTQRTAWIIATGVLTFRPRATKHDRELMSAVASGCVAALGDCSPELQTLSSAIAETYVSAQPPPIALYRKLGASFTTEERVAMRAVLSFHFALHSWMSSKSAVDPVRSARRVESRARAAGVRLLRVLAKSFQRRAIATPSSRLRACLAGWRPLILRATGPTQVVPPELLITTLHQEGALPNGTTALLCELLESPALRERLNPNVVRAMLDTTRRDLLRAEPQLRRQVARAGALALDNRFAECVSYCSRHSLEVPELHALSLGLHGSPRRQSKVTPSPTMRIVLGYLHPDSLGAQKSAEGSPGSDYAAAVLRARNGTHPNGPVLSSLMELVRRDRPWAERMIVGVVGARACLARNRTRAAAEFLRHSHPAYRGLLSLVVGQAPPVVPAPLLSYETACERVLAAWSPPVDPGRSAVETLRRLVESLPKRRRRPRRTMAALDAIVAAGQSANSQDVDRRIVKQVARMLGARVLFYYRHGEYLDLQDCREHTLTTWTIHRLVRTHGVRARKIRRSHAIWQPGQRRPRGVLSAPVGEGVACWALDRPFRRKEVRAVRTVLRFLRARRKGGPQYDAATRSQDQEARSTHPLPGLIGSSQPWIRVLDQVWRAAPASCPVLVVGDSGTGKEHVARALHLGSDRAQQPFVAINAGALAPDVLTSELFGHVRGAYSGAVRDHKGLFEQAHRGTLFLDELGEMPAPMQAALLRVIEDGRVRPLGADRTLRVDVRVIAATHRQLHDMVALGTFREDLLHRLDVVRIALPPLRERMDDLPALAEHLLRRAGIEKRVSSDAWDTLFAWAWPGNVRELDNVLRAAALMSDSPELTGEMIEYALRPRRQAWARSGEEGGPRVTARAASMLERMGRNWWRARTLAEVLNVSGRTVNRDLRRLMQDGLVECVGEARARRYRRACNDDKWRDSS